MTKKAKIVWVIVIIIIIAAIIAGIWYLNSGTKNQSGNETIKIGAQLSLTSFGASWGENSLKGAQLATEEINKNGGVMGKQLQLIVEDNQTNANSAVNATNKLITVDKIPNLHKICGHSKYRYRY